ncbi:MAG: hypothetical protein QXP14_03335, partial [Candidatus Nitrosocaldus sp.]
MSSKNASHYSSSYSSLTPISPTHINLNPSICMQCRGSKYLCGLAYCPILVSSVKAMLERIDVDKSIDGYTPPSIFVGRLGYPKVSIGPMVPVPVQVVEHDMG